MHPGHTSFLKQAAAHGDFLTVVVARDQNVLSAKGYIPLWDEEMRLAAVAKLPFVSKAILGSPAGHYTLIDIISENPDVVCLGYDQWPTDEKLMTDLTLVGIIDIQIRRLLAFKPHLYKSSILRDYIETKEL